MPHHRNHEELYILWVEKNDLELSVLSLKAVLSSL